MAARNEGEALLRVADHLCAELGQTAEVEAPAEQWAVPAGRDQSRWARLPRQQESSVGTMREALARVAVAAANSGSTEVSERMLGIALDGAELAMRSAFARDDAAGVAPLMPGFVFLVTLLAVDQDRALALSQRTEQLVHEYLA